MYHTKSRKRRTVCALFVWQRSQNRVGSQYRNNIKEISNTPNTLVIKMADEDHWTHPFKKEYHPILVRFMSFLHGRPDDPYPLKTKRFTREELLEIRPNDIVRWFCLLVYDDPDPNKEILKPKHGRASCIEQYKKAISYYMPYRHTPWVNDQGNPTWSAPVNDLIKEIKKAEVRGEGTPSNAKRPLQEAEFRRTMELLKGQQSFECQYRFPMMCLWQYHLIGRIDDVVHFTLDDPRGHPNFDFALRTRVRWSKNVMEERRCPDQTRPTTTQSC